MHSGASSAKRCKTYMMFSRSIPINKPLDFFLNADITINSKKKGWVC